MKPNHLLIQMDIVKSSKQIRRLDTWFLSGIYYSDAEFAQMRDKIIIIPSEVGGVSDQFCDSKPKVEQPVDTYWSFAIEQKG